MNDKAKWLSTVAWILGLVTLPEHIQARADELYLEGYLPGAAASKLRRHV
jgi:hypothetical protein